MAGIQTHDPPLLSIIIPTLNEEASIGTLIQFIKQQSLSDQVEILVCDGGSTDKTCALAAAENVQLLQSSICRRSVQMNLAARHAKAPLLYFLHADTTPPFDFIRMLLEFPETNKKMYCFPFRFHSDKIILKLNQYVSRRKGWWTGGGDQSLLIEKEIFQQLEGYNPEFQIMEDYDLIARAQKSGLQLQIATSELRASDRKYWNRSWLRVQLTHILVLLAWQLGAKQHTLVWLYQKGIH